MPIFYNTKVSIITVCRNEKARIEQTIESVLNQDYDNIEYLVIDGQSTDGTVELIQKHKGIHQFLSEPDTGIYNAMNKGIQLSTGDYLLFLNGGDYFYNSSSVRQLVAALNSSQSKADETTNSTSKAEIIYGDLACLDVNNNLIYHQAPPQLTLEFLLNATLWHPCCLIAKSLFTQHGLYRECYKIVADYEFFLRVVGVHNVATKHCPATISVFRLDGLSSKLESRNLLLKERQKAQLSNFPPLVIKMYESWLELHQEVLIFNRSIAFKFSKIFTKFSLFKKILRLRFIHKP